LFVGVLLPCSLENGDRVAVGHSYYPAHYLSGVGRLRKRESQCDKGRSYWIQIDPYDQKFWLKSPVGQRGSVLTTAE
jgi:hypothetical protein